MGSMCTMKSRRIDAMSLLLCTYLLRRCQGPVNMGMPIITIIITTLVIITIIAVVESNRLNCFLQVHNPSQKLYLRE